MSKKLLSSQKKRLLTVAIFTVLIISIIAIASSIFFPTTSSGFSELSLLTYNDSSQTFEADRYPYSLESGVNRTIFFMVKNFEDVVKYYQIQIKVTKISQNATYEYPLNSAKSHLLYENDTYEKILSPATRNEKRESGTFSGDYIWSPVNVTLYSNALVEAVLEGDDFMKIVFELWEFNSTSNSFEYSGIFTFLELLYYY
ncbi:MAG: DUF1616 domain-containing protein [Candidatus Heimdallarchaeota archaeon]|nr:DUF1616 domain-containing protein [Candidatus Heimdallarchaeota archaeon]